MQRFEEEGGLEEWSGAAAETNPNHAPLHFPIMEAPNQKPEQAPVQFRQFFYNIADEEPVHVFWDDENDNTDNNHDDDDDENPNQNNHNDKDRFVVDPEEEQEPDRRPRRRRLSTHFWFLISSLLGTLCVISLLVMISVCVTGHCYDKAATDDQTNGGSSEWGTNSGSNIFIPQSTTISRTNAPSVAPTPMAFIPPSVFVVVHLPPPPRDDPTTTTSPTGTSVIFTTAPHNNNNTPSSIWYNDSTTTMLANHTTNGTHTMTTAADIDFSISTAAQATANATATTSKHTNIEWHDDY